MSDAGDSRIGALGEFIRQQRQRANLSLRQLADRTRISNPYLSQIERGKHQPSVRVLKSLSDALGLPVETLFAHAGVLKPEQDTRPDVSVEDAILAEDRLSAEQKQALISVYRSMLPPTPN